MDSKVVHEPFNNIVVNTVCKPFNNIDVNAVCEPFNNIVVNAVCKPFNNIFENTVEDLIIPNIMIENSTKCDLQS